ncbi:phosphatidylinositol 3-kinase [Cavenderia fasciculata]|uniref:Phosphatidylinositol 3-kinase n=1 Tax=Cavenderia fasciculata TaxID=261658 RepID=F4Q9M2_CACFS|nr:phosphatidylinositol 3-kinase [Cavenderia fasciculata]EGG15391.1 phosphatidylinositol 3-kinase [Cavenderia fasciculata]|eukprot:XP_004354133.1 phosphatidylinositol 3-kinase [Cavenderia fasciculata]
MDTNQYRYSKSFFNDGFQIHIKIGDSIKRFTFQSSTTVDHVKYEIFKQTKEITQENRQNYFLALNRTVILQIEFVKFIFAHEDIQKALLTKQSVEVFLVPKSKEIRARKHKADIIKKRLGNFKQIPHNNILLQQQQQQQHKRLSTDSVASGSAATNTSGSGGTYTDDNFSDVSSQLSPDITPLSPLQLPSSVTSTGISIDELSLQEEEDLLILKKKNALINQNNNNNKNEQSSSASESFRKRDTFGLFATLKQQQNDQQHLLPDLKNLSTTTMESVDDEDKDNLSPRRRSQQRKQLLIQSTDAFVVLDEFGDEEEILRQKLQQQLVQLEDEELKFQAQAADDSDLLIGGDSDFSGSENEKEKESPTLLSTSGDTLSPTLPAISSPQLTQQQIYRKSISKVELLNQEKRLSQDFNQQLQQQQPTEPEEEKKQQEEEEELHWSNNIQMKQKLMEKDHFPLLVSTLSMETSLIVQCPKISSTMEFKNQLIESLQSIVHLLKVGTFAIDQQQDILPISSNSIIHNFVESSLNNCNIPKLIVLKPGMIDLVNQQLSPLSGSPLLGQSVQLSISPPPPFPISSSNPLTMSGNYPNQQPQQPDSSTTSSSSSASKPIPIARGGSVFFSSKPSSMSSSPMSGSPLIRNLGNTNQINKLNQQNQDLKNNSNNNNSKQGKGNKNKKQDAISAAAAAAAVSQPTSPTQQKRNRNITVSFSLGEQRDSNVKQIMQRKKLAQIQIGSLLGKPLCWSNGETEIKYFRTLMDNLFNFGQLDARDRVKVTLAQVTTAPNDPLLPAAFRIRFYLPPDNHSTAINVNMTDLMSKIIERVISKHNNTTKLLTDQKAQDFIVRITGTSDHVLRDCEIGQLDMVRQRLQRRKDINFSLIHRSALPDIYIDGHTATNNSNMIFLNPNLNNNLFINQFNQQHIQQQQQQPQPMQMQSNQNHIKRSILLYEINRPFEIRIICLENLNNQLASHFLQDGSVNDVKLSVVAELVHGEEPLAPPMETFTKAHNNPLWCQWLRSSLLMCDLPRATKLCFTVYAMVGSNQRVAIGWVDLQLIDYKSQLQSGVISLILWPGDRTMQTSEYADICPNLVVELLQFPFPVLFPRSELMERTEIKDYVEARKEDEVRLDQLINKDPMYKLSEDERKFIWTYRMHLRKFPHSLSKVLQSLPWNQPQQVKEAHRLLSIWEPLSPHEALELLDVKFADELVREYAVNCLRSLSDGELALFLLQLVQSVKHEPHHDSALARFLIHRALANRSVIGHPFFWHLEAEMHNVRISDRYSLILETYLRGCGDQRHEFVKQMEVVTKLTTIAKMVKEAAVSKRKNLLLDELSKLSLPNTFHLPTSASTESCGLIVSECKWLDSFTVPLWLVFQNVDPLGEPIVVIFKNGDDLRQDILTLQMITLMDNLWKRDGLDTHMSLYNVTSTGEGCGFIEVVSDSETVADIQKAAGGVTAAFTKTPLANWLKERNPTDAEYEYTVNNFIHSLTGYCVATYILGISDRHNDNIMVSKSGHLFHIDFAHFLGNIMKFHGYKREKAPFVLTPEFAHVIGGEKSKSFAWFTELCCTSFNIIRKQRNLFIILFNLMLSTGIPELSTRNDIDYLREAFLMDEDDEEAKQSFARLITKSLKTKTTQVLFAMHILAHSDNKINQ